jgi:hypothetical protein
MMLPPPDYFIFYSFIGMEVNLKIAERLRLSQALPEKGSLATMKILIKLRDKLLIDQKEWKEYGVKEVDGKVHWDPKKDKGKSYEFGRVEEKLIVNALEDLNKGEEVRAEHVSLLDKFEIGGEE